MKFITKNKELILQIIIVILVIVLFYYLLKKSKENFELKYVINSEDNEKKAVTYNIDKYVIMSNNLGNALKFDGSRFFAKSTLKSYKCILYKIQNFNKISHFKTKEVKFVHVLILD